MSVLPIPPQSTVSQADAQPAGKGPAGRKTVKANPSAQQINCTFGPGSTVVKPHTAGGISGSSCVIKLVAPRKSDAGVTLRQVAGQGDKVAFSHAWIVLAYAQHMVEKCDEIPAPEREAYLHNVARRALAYKQAVDMDKADWLVVHESICSKALQCLTGGHMTEKQYAAIQAMT